MLAITLHRRASTNNGKNVGAFERTPFFDLTPAHHGCASPLPNGEGLVFKIKKGTPLSVPFVSPYARKLLNSYPGRSELSP